MHLDGITLHVLAAENTHPEEIEWQVTKERDNEYIAHAENQYCHLHFRITELPGCRIWHTRFLIKKEMALRVVTPFSITFLWAAWKNHLSYTMQGFPRNRIPANHYNLYHLPEAQWTLHFRQPGEYETFNVLFTSSSLQEWKAEHHIPTLKAFLDQATRDQPAFLSPGHLRLTPDQQHVIEALIRGPVDHVDRQEYYDEKVTDLFFQVLRQMAKADSASHTILRQPDREKLYKIKEYILAHLDKPETLKLKKLARTAGMSETKLEAVFRQLSGMSAHQFIYEQRMQKAYRLLRETDLLVKEVAAQVGYKNSSNFTEAFTRHFGSTPTQVSKG